MLQISDRSIEAVIEVFARQGVEAGYLVPTSTGMAKGILDAHADLREYLRLSGFHNYATQPQGVANKRVIVGSMLTAGGIAKVTVSLYRPESKSGDPRIWIYGLPQYARAGNLLGIFVHAGQFYVANLSDNSILSPSGVPGSTLQGLLAQLQAAGDVIANELLAKMRAISTLGWVPSLRTGSTGIGFTLESMLNIRANNSRFPDYKGIEIKASRLGPNATPSQSRSTLFAKTPDWGKSTVRGSADLLHHYGYQRSPIAALKDAPERRQLYCSLNDRPNSLGHYLAVSDDSEALHSMFSALASPPLKILHWDADVLHSSLKQKHKETFWVQGSRRQRLGREEFWFSRIVHTKGPLLANFMPLIKGGFIELDYTVKEVLRTTGGSSVSDHGYLFKIWSRHIPKLFPEPRVYDL